MDLTDIVPNKITGANAGRAASVGGSDALSRPRRSVLACCGRVELMS